MKQKKFAIAVVLYFFAQHVISSSCAQVVDVVFLNGISNTRAEASDSAYRLQIALNEMSNRTSFPIKFRVVSVFNPMGYYGNTGIASLPQDLKELFLLKTSEEIFSKDFSRILYKDKYGVVPPLLPDVAAATKVKIFHDDLTPDATSIEKEGEVDDFRMSGVRSALTSISQLLFSKKKVIIVAHSQGNLLANLSWANHIATYGAQATVDKIRVINVANTSMFSVNGFDLTRYGDNALFFLEELLASHWKRNTPLCTGECEFQLAGPTFLDNEYELLGHGFKEVYLSDAPSTMISNTYEVPFLEANESVGARLVDYIHAAANSLNYYKSGDLNSVDGDFSGSCSKVVSLGCEVVGVDDGLYVIRWVGEGYAISDLNSAAVMFNVQSGITIDNLSDLYPSKMSCDDWSGSTLRYSFYSHGCLRAEGDKRRTKWTGVTYQAHKSLSDISIYYPAISTMINITNPQALLTSGVAGEVVYVDELYNREPFFKMSCPGKVYLNWE